MFDKCWNCGAKDVMPNEDGECPHCYHLLEDPNNEEEQDENK